MSRKRNRHPVIERLVISDIAAEGMGLGRHEGMAVFVPQLIPGDIADIRLIRKKKNYSEGIVVKFHEYSAIRIEPFCSHFGVCGGCKWQHLPYYKQLEYKQKQVYDALQRIGKADIESPCSIIASEGEQYYRNKLEYTFSTNRWLSAEEIAGEGEVSNRNALGFHIPGRFDRILDIEKCYLQPAPSNEIRTAVRNYALQHGLGFYDQVSQKGFLRNLIIRNTLKGEFMVVLSVQHEQPYEPMGLLEHLSEKFPQLTSLMYVVNPKANDTINDLDIKLFKGNDFLVEEMDGLKFKIGPKSFFQTNTGQALTMYQKVRELASITGNEHVYDLYTGTGTIALFLAPFAKKVTGIEYVPEAIKDAWENCRLNGLNNLAFYAGDIKEVLSPGFVAHEGKPDVVVVDPPRAGMHPEVVSKLLEMKPSRIIYVSCNPATQARDVNLLLPTYNVKLVQPIDMFPHTHHVENITLLEQTETPMNEENAQ